MQKFSAMQSLRSSGTYLNWNIHCEGGEKSVKSTVNGVGRTKFSINTLGVAAYTLSGLCSAPHCLREQIKKKKKEKEKEREKLKSSEVPVRKWGLSDVSERGASRWVWCLWRLPNCCDRLLSGPWSWAIIIDLISRKHSLCAGSASRGVSGSPGNWKRHRGHLGFLSFPASWTNSNSDCNLQGD